MFNFSNWILGVQTVVTSIELGSIGLLVGVAQSAMTALAIVLVMMLFIRSAQSIEHGQPAALGGFIVLMLKVALCIAVLAAWSVPMPGLGSPIGTWIPNQGLNLARMAGWDGAQTVAVSLSSLSGMEVPSGIFVSIGTFYWIFAIICWFVANLIMAIVLVGPMLVIVSLVIIGPIFVPMWIVPELTAYARGYIRCLVTYSLVPVILAIILNVIGHILRAINTGFGIATSVEDFLPRSLLLIVSLGASIYGMFAGISKSNHIMSGSAGSGLGWIAGAATAVKAVL